MKERLQKIKEEAIARIKESKNPESLNDVRVSVLGKKGELTALLKSMKQWRFMQEIRLCVDLP